MAICPHVNCCLLMTKSQFKGSNFSMSSPLFHEPQFVIDDPLPSKEKSQLVVTFEELPKEGKWELMKVGSLRKTLHLMCC